MPTEMHGDATPRIFENARILRRKQTEAEKLLWSLLKNRQLVNSKFRRQHAISLFIADFYCHEAKLVIELDGGYHTAKEIQLKDEERAKIINDFGITVLRFKNNEILENSQAVLDTIVGYLP